MTELLYLCGCNGFGELSMDLGSVAMGLGSWSGWDVCVKLSMVVGAGRIFLWGFLVVLRRQR